ncbi:MAG: hypothetical protein KKB20_14220 [Proteobacteria bacterium]|nr:hypothetical protein [Pseudomonadota bacterium]
MHVSSAYICPVRGLAGLEPPETTALRRAAASARGLGIEALVLPVLEEALLVPVKAKVRLLDGLASALEWASDAGLRVRIAFPAQRVLGLDWAAPYLVGGAATGTGGPVFTAGRLRHLKPYAWWKDPAILRKRVAAFREVAAALSGHPALSGWILMDQVLTWSRPDPWTADLLFRSYLAEVRERDEGAAVYLSLDWTELSAPDAALLLAARADGLRLTGLDHPRPVQSLSEDLIRGAVLSSVAEWLFERPVEVEAGWGPAETGDPDEMAEAARCLAGQDPAGLVWPSLMDPEPGLAGRPPWSLRPGLDRIGLLRPDGDPKPGIEGWLAEMRSTKPEPAARDFIDLGRDEYLGDPRLHLDRLREHFRDRARFQ